VDEATMRALGAEVMRLTRRRATSYPGSVLEDSAFRLLLVLVEEGPRSLRDLAHELQLEQSTISRQVTAAVSHGLVERYGESPRLVRATGAGQEAYLHDGRLRGEVWSRAIAELGAERGARLIAALHELNDALDRAHAAVRASDSSGAGSAS
jgi:DNA-binding MarR family transcriptional regulator